MKVSRLVDGVLGGLAAMVIVGACAPEVTVSRDDEEENAGGAGASDSTGGTAGTAETGGTAGIPPETGGSPATGGTGGVGPTTGGGPSTGGVGPTTGGGPSTGGVGPTACHCSRRPDAPLSRNCPRGAGISSSTYVEAAGVDAELSGTAATVGSPFRVRVFAGSVAYNTELILTELTLAAPEEFFDYSPMYRVEPDDLDFVNGGEVSIPWQAADGVVPTALAIYHSESEDGPFERMEDSYQNAGFSQATILRSGYFFVGVPKPPEFEHCP
jgi:hypothetical protein